mmetsp:Transcript_13290/g.28517  ORF Transcript_13290/g.28517 Transcript_13290/m.28517 type:complete len:205 (+) Transcript_13290:718-1332(+)
MVGYQFEFICDFDDILLLAGWFINSSRSSQSSSSSSSSSFDSIQSNTHAKRIDLHIHRRPLVVLVLLFFLIQDIRSLAHNVLLANSGISPSVIVALVYDAPIVVDVIIIIIIMILTANSSNQHLTLIQQLPTTTILPSPQHIIQSPPPQFPLHSPLPLLDKRIILLLRHTNLQRKRLAYIVQLLQPFSPYTLLTPGIVLATLSP